MKTLGITLLALGILMMIYTGFNYITTKKVADVGPVQIDKKENHTVQWSPIAGGVLLIGGIIILVSGKKGSAV
jgi:uncharacterized membrane protein